MLKATVSGSFHRHMHAIYLAVAELRDAGVEVLSPADPRVVDQTGDFLFVASDRTRSIRLVQDRHLESIRASDLLWLVAPDGYLGQSASMELGFAVAHDVPIFCEKTPTDLTLRRYVHVVPSIRFAIEAAESMAYGRGRFKSFLIDPHASIEAAHDMLEEIQGRLNKKASEIDDDVAGEIYERRRRISRLLIGPSPTQRDGV